MTRVGGGSAGRLGYGEAAVQALAGEMVEELSGMGHPADAAALTAEYLSDADNAVALLSQARQWREALRVAYRCAPHSRFALSPSPLRMDAPFATHAAGASEQCS